MNNPDHPSPFSSAPQGSLFAARAAKVEALFKTVLELPPEQRDRRFAEAAAEDPSLEEEVRELLAAHERAGAFLAAPAVDPELEEAMAAFKTEAEGDLIGRYKLLQQIGIGGFGSVWMAEQTEPMVRKVALKIVQVGMNSKEVVSRFEQERQALALMDHPNIAKVFDAGATKYGRPYFVMELVKGIPITQFCNESGYGTHERVALFCDVCSAIQHAHQKGIIHRDIKPSNVMVTLHGEKPVVKVIDFGIAKATHGKLTEKTLFTRFEQFIGTPVYMSPEQAALSGLDIDTRSDIYALGVLLYELLTGKPPFDAETLASAGYDEMRRIIREVEPPKPSSRLGTMAGEERTLLAKTRRVAPEKIRQLVEPDLDWIVMKAMDKDRSRRFETVNGLAADLQNFLSNDPVSARPASLGYKLTKAIRRNRFAFAAGAAIILALSIGGGVSAWQAVRATNASRLALAAQANEREQRRVAEQAAERAEQARLNADRESVRARHAAAVSDARRLLQDGLLRESVTKASEAFRLGGAWEDGLLLHEIAATARKNWGLIGRVPLENKPQAACLLRTANGRPRLVLSFAGQLQAYDGNGGALLASIAPGSPVTKLENTSEAGQFLALSNRELSRYALPNLELQASRPLAVPAGHLSCHGKVSLLFIDGQDIRLIATDSLADIDSFDWTRNPVAKTIPLPRSGASASDGSLVLLRGGAWNHPVLQWDRRQQPAVFSAVEIPAQELGFFNETRVGSLVLSGSDDSEATNYLGLWNIGDTAVRTYWHPVPNEDTKGRLDFQVWSSKAWGYGEAFPIFGMVGRSGLAIKSLDAPVDITLSDRFENLLPTETSTPEFLAANISTGLLALWDPSGISIFGPATDPRRRYDATCVTRAGSIGVGRTDSDAPAVEFTPFDALAPERIFSLQWPADSKWIPWAITATPDGETVAVIAQETDSDAVITSTYGRIRALVYRPGDWAKAPAAWPIASAFEVDAPTGNAYSPRLLTLSPDGGVLLYWNSASLAARHDTATGRALGSLELGLSFACSRDGARVAAVSPSGVLRVYDLASGAPLFQRPADPVAKLCFSTDGSRLVTSSAGRLAVHDIATGEELSALATDLSPLAYPRSANRFLAFRAAPAGGGEIVLADTHDANVVAVVRRASGAFVQAFFSDSERELAYARIRESSSVLRSLRPEELGRTLQANRPRLLVTANITSTEISTAAPVDEGGELPQIAADDVTALRAMIGRRVVVAGRVRAVSMVAARNAANVILDGTAPGSGSVNLWIPWTSFPAFRETHGPDLQANLAGKSIQATGRLEKYGGRRLDWKDMLQLTLTDPGALVVTQPANTPRN